jgi:hypothetical protein
MCNIYLAIEGYRPYPEVDGKWLCSKFDGSERLTPEEL